MKWCAISRCVNAIAAACCEFLGREPSTELWARVGRGFRRFARPARRRAPGRGAACRPGQHARVSSRRVVYPVARWNDSVQEEVRHDADAAHWVNSSGRRNTSTARSCDGAKKTSTSQSGPASTDALTRPTSRLAPGASAAVLGRDRSRAFERGRRHRRRSLTGGRRAVVPSSWRHATISPDPASGRTCPSTRERDRHPPARGCGFAR